MTQAQQPPEGDAPPIWLLDVDGVVNALDPGQHAWPDFTTFSARGYTIRYSPTLLGRIAELHGSGAVEVWWLTTWWDTANQHLAARFGLPKLVVANTAQEYAARGCWWKLPVAQRVRTETGRRLIWTDDDLDYVDEAWEWVRGQAGQVLAICPDSYVGLTPQHLSEIEAWLRTPPNST